MNILIIFVTLIFLSETCRCETVPILNLLTIDKIDDFGYTVLSVTNLSLQKVDELYGSYFKINYTFASAGDRCTPKGKMTTIAEARFSSGIDLLLGPVCESDLDIAAAMASTWNIPIMSPSGSRVINKTEFSTLINMAFTMEQFGDFYLDIFRIYQWMDIALLYEDIPLLKLVAESLLDSFEKNNKRTTLFAFKDKTITHILNEASKVSRVFATVCTGDSFQKLILTAQSLGMTNGDYVYLFIKYLEKNEAGNHLWKELLDMDARSAYDSVLVLQPSRPDSVEYFKLVEDVKIKALKEYNFTIKDQQVELFETAFYDSVSIYAQVINETLAQNGDIRHGDSIVNRMKGRTFRGIYGNITIDDNGNRETDFQLLDMNMSTGEFIVAAEYWGASKKTLFLKNIHWPSIEGPPKNVPRCGFQHEKPECKEYEINVTGLVIGLFVGILVVGIVIYTFIYRRLKLEADLRNYWWNIRKEDLVFSSQIVGSKRSKLSVLMSTDEIQSYKFEANSATGFKTENRKYAYYKGNIVSVVKTNIARLTINRELLKELKLLKDVQCTNLAKFVGLYRCLDGVFIVMENCSRGSLQDILHNDSVVLDWDFKAALITDLVNGMTYLHDSQIVLHGRLNSERCLIDSRFGLKVCDFGLPSIFGFDPVEKVENETEYFWFAPECLRGNKVSQAADVYSFGIILYEILTRTSPFETTSNTLTTADLLKKIKNRTGTPFRPSLPIITDKPEIVELMKICWDEISFKRPTFKSIKKQLKDITGISAGHNLLDALLRRMEQYADNLEELVGQRTEAFLEEKRKSDLLLEQLLPKTVADKLKNNQTVDPEAYESVTIYFSDIVGFTVLSSESSPMEIVDLLNGLYSLFDEIIDRYDVYKVETIGDAYMVVSGLPTRNGNNHVCEIARMSLEIVRNASNFKIKHLPEKQLKARIGIHSGPVCAGVVGTKMPRYCLFGDTVNTASRMESHGEAMKIHVSSDTKTLLDHYGCFRLEPRGGVEIKGKGKMETYWLVADEEKPLSQTIIEIKDNLELI